MGSDPIYYLFLPFFLLLRRGEEFPTGADKSRHADRRNAVCGILSVFHLDSARPTGYNYGNKLEKFGYFVNVGPMVSGAGKLRV